MSQINKNEAVVGFVVSSVLIIIVGDNITQIAEFFISFKVIFRTQKAKSHLFNYCIYCNYTPYFHAFGHAVSISSCNYIFKACNHVIIKMHNSII